MKRSRDYEPEIPMKRVRESQNVAGKRKRVEIDQQRKRTKTTEDEVQRLRKEKEVHERESLLMRQACFTAGNRIEQLQARVQELEMLLSMQRVQMERIRLNNNITVY